MGGRADSPPPGKVRQRDVTLIYACIDEVRSGMEVARARYEGVEVQALETAVLDLARIFVVGEGAGGTLAYRLASEPRPARSDVIPWFEIRAVAVVGGTIGGSYHAFESTVGTVDWSPIVRSPPLGAVQSQLYVSIMHIHRMDDESVVPGPEGSMTSQTSLTSQQRYLDMGYHPLIALVLARIDKSMTWGLEWWSQHLGTAPTFVIAESAPGYVLVGGLAGIRYKELILEAFPTGTREVIHGVRVLKPDEYDTYTRIWEDFLSTF